MWADAHILYTSTSNYVPKVLKDGPILGTHLFVPGARVFVLVEVQGVLAASAVELAQERGRLNDALLLRGEWLLARRLVVGDKGCGVRVGSLKVGYAWPLAIGEGGGGGADAGQLRAQ